MILNVSTTVANGPPQLLQLKVTDASVTVPVVVLISMVPDICGTPEIPEILNVVALAGVTLATAPSATALTATA